MARRLGVRGGMDHPLAPFFLGRRNVKRYVIELKKSEFKIFTAFPLGFLAFVAEKKRVCVERGRERETWISGKARS